jgi:hypothetical protein
MILLVIQQQDDITCLAVHPTGHTVATGALGKVPKIVLWDAQSGATLKASTTLYIPYKFVYLTVM